MIIPRYRNGEWTPHNDPLIRVCAVDRERAIEAVMREEEHTFQVEAYVQLTTPINELFRKEYRNIIGDEPTRATMNRLIYEHVRKWVEDKIIRGWRELKVEDFVYEVIVEDGEFYSTYGFKYPEVYKQLEEGKAPIEFFCLDKYTLHAMAKEWLDKNANK